MLPGRLVFHKKLKTTYKFRCDGKDAEPESEIIDSTLCEAPSPIGNISANNLLFTIPVLGPGFAIVDFGFNFRTIVGEKDAASIEIRKGPQGDRTCCFPRIEHFTSPNGTQHLRLHFKLPSGFKTIPNPEEPQEQPKDEFKIIFDDITLEPGTWFYLDIWIQKIKKSTDGENEGSRQLRLREGEEVWYRKI